MRPSEHPTSTAAWRLFWTALKGLGNATLPLHFKAPTARWMTQEADRVLSPIRQHLAHSPGLRLCLAGTFDLDFWARARPLPDWMEAPTHLQAFANDSTEGLFLLDVRDGRVFYVSREGSFGCVASTPSDGLQTLVALPYWRDLIDIGGLADPTVLHKHAEALERQALADEPHLPALRRYVSQALGLPEDLSCPRHAAERLRHHVMHNTRRALWVEVDRRRCTPLLGATSAQRCPPTEVCAPER